MILASLHPGLCSGTDGGTADALLFAEVEDEDASDVIFESNSSVIDGSGFHYDSKICTEGNGHHSCMRIKQWLL